MKEVTEAQRLVKRFATQISALFSIKVVVVGMTTCNFKQIFAISTNGQRALMISACYCSV